ncbi:MAG: hypothetical protein LBD20_06135, partial [Spirochaetaceae bacterium]|nr:hypothetical protein [Spirochaetaceae bacterium]
LERNLESAGFSLRQFSPPPKPLIHRNTLLQGLYEDFYTYSFIGLVKNMDESKRKYPAIGYNASFGFSSGWLGFCYGFDFFDLFNNGISIISMVTFGFPLKILIYTVKPYIGIGADVFTIINAQDYANYETISDNASGIFGADFELGIQVMIHWFFLSAAYRQRIYPSKKNSYIPKNGNQNNAVPIFEELFFKRFVISIGVRG